MRFLPKEDVTKKIITRNKKKQIEYTLHDKFLTQKLITLLTEGLYEHPHYAAFREILTNAVEANQVNNQPKDKLDIYLSPNCFIIRDYGPGLTEEDIFKVFCSFFYSTKDETNDFIGGFGLGAKAPFAVNDHFFVTSYKDGIETTYKIYLDYDQSLIRYEIIDQKETDEPNGCKVKVQFKESSQFSWMNEVRLGLLFVSLGLNPYKYDINVDFRYPFVTTIAYEKTEEYEAYYSIYPSMIYFKGSTFCWYGDYESSGRVFFSMDVEDITIPASRDDLHVPIEWSSKFSQKHRELINLFEVNASVYEYGLGKYFSTDIFTMISQDSNCVVFIPKKLESRASSTIRKKMLDIFRHKYKDADYKLVRFFILRQSEIQPILDFLGVTFDELFSHFRYKIDLEKDAHYIPKKKKIANKLISTIRQLLSKGYYVTIIECNGHRVIKKFTSWHEYQKFVHVWNSVAKVEKITYSSLRNRKPSKKLTLLIPYQQKLPSLYSYYTIYLSKDKDIMKMLNGDLYYKLARFCQHVDHDLLNKKTGVNVYDIDNIISDKVTNLKTPITFEIPSFGTLSYGMFDYYVRRIFNEIQRLTVYPNGEVKIERRVDDNCV